MPRIGVYYLALSSNNPSPSSKLIDHLSCTYPEQPHKPYTLDHRLFVDTSSQLPGSDPKRRQYTQTLTTSHNKQSTFVGSTEPGSTKQSFITIPSSSLDAFTALILTKLQPLWFPRQFVLIDNGVSVAFTAGFNICIGDVKVAPRQAGAGSIRGMLVELRQDDVEHVDEDEITEQTEAEDRAYLAAIFNDNFRETGVVMDESKMIVTRTRQAADEPLVSGEIDCSLAKAYMTVLRRSR